MKKIFSIVFLLPLLSLIFSGTIVSAQENLPPQNPDVAASRLSTDLRFYNAGETVTGTFVLKNKKAFDTGNVYYEIALIGGDQKGKPLMAAYQFSERMGPFYVPALSEIPMEFEFALPAKKPAEFLGLRVDTFLQNGMHIGRAVIPLSVEGEVLPYLDITSPRIRINGIDVPYTQKVVIKEGQEARFIYSVRNTTSSTVTLEPQYKVLELRNQEETYAAYSEDKIILTPNSAVTLVHNARVFFDEPGVYAAQLKMVDANGDNRTMPIVFSYIVDGDFATIDSIVTDSTDALSRGDDFTVGVLYTGKLGTDQVTKEVSMVINVKDENGRIVAESNEIVNLNAQGRIDTVLEAQRSAKGFTVEVKFTKDGGLLAQEILEVPSYSNEVSAFQVISIIIFILVLFALVLVYLKKKNGKILAICFAFMVFGLSAFAFDASAYTTVYDVGYAAHQPTNVVTNVVSAQGYTTPTNDGFSLEVSFQMPNPVVPDGYSSDPSYTNTGSNFWVYFMNPWQSGPSWSGPFSTENWYEGPPSAQLTPGPCDDEGCDVENYDYWYNAYNPYNFGDTVESGSCTSIGCNLSFAFSIWPSGEVGEDDFYVYLRNQYQFTAYENGESAPVIDRSTGMLLYDTIEFYDPYNTPLDDSGAVCNISVGDPGSPVMLTVTSYQCVPDSSYEDGFKCEWDFPPFGQGDGATYMMIGGSTQPAIYNDNFFYRWGGDLGDNPVGDQLMGGGDMAYYAVQPTPRELVPYGTSNQAFCTGTYQNTEHDQQYQAAQDQYLNGSYTNPEVTVTNYAYNASTNKCARTLGISYDVPEEIYEEQCTDTGYDADGDGVNEQSCSQVYVTTQYNQVREDIVQVSLTLESSQYWGKTLTTTYNASTSAPQVYFEYFDPDFDSYDMPYSGDSWRNPNNWTAVMCSIGTVGSDICSNIEGIQTVAPTDFEADEATGTCFPTSLALYGGTVTLTANPNNADIGEGVEWTFELSDSFFQGVLDGVLYTIPRVASITWSGDITDSAYLGSGSTEVTPASELTMGLPDTDSDKLIAYSEPGVASITVTIQDPYAILTATAYATIGEEVCLEEECRVPCVPEGVPCDNNISGDNAVVSNFTIDPSIANEDNECSLSWTTNNMTESCNLIGPTGSTAVATSSAGYDVGPGSYLLSCVNYAPEIVSAGPRTCLQNPDVKEN